MGLRLRYLVRSLAAVAAGLAATACSTTMVAPSNAPGAADMQKAPPASFTFALPAGTRYVWTERRTFVVSLVGADLVDRDASELRWDVTTHPSSYGTTVVDQRLVAVRVTHDGVTVVEGAPVGADLQLVIDSGGNLQDVRGLEEAAKAVQALASPAREPRVARLFSPQDLRTLVVTRHDLFLGDVVFRPAQEGATWVVPRRTGNEALLRRYTVERVEACDSGSCARLRVSIPLDPSVVQDVARGIVERHLAAQESETASVSVKRSRYAMRGTIVVQPATMRSYGANLTESGRALVVAPGGHSYEVTVHATTEDTYDYAPAAVSLALRESSIGP
jgi:hypothetical protein